MLLSSWYAKWKEERIREAVEQAKKQGYEEGYKAGKSEAREAAATNPEQVNKDETVPTSTSPSRVPDRKEEVKEYLKSDSHASRVKI